MGILATSESLGTTRTRDLEAGSQTRTGSRVADFDTLYATHARYIAGVVHRIMGHDHELDDIVQETFVDALEGLARLEDPTCARAWLVTVAVRRTRRLLTRRRFRDTFAFWMTDLSASASDPRDRGPVDDLYDALSRLPADVRIPWVLHRVERLSIPETAKACEVSPATVKRRIADAEERIARRGMDQMNKVTLPASRPDQGDDR